MSRLATHFTSLSSLLGQPVLALNGSIAGRVRELLVNPTNSNNHIAYLALTLPANLAEGQISVVSVASLTLDAYGALRLCENAAPETLQLPTDLVFLEKDLLDQQIIDVHGSKVVRVNDVDLAWEPTHNGDEGWSLRIAEVEVGIRGAVRRLLKGIPRSAVEAAAHRFQARVIPWEFVDLIDRDPSRRVRLKVGQDRLASMHPSDIADILEELSPSERDAVFTSLDEELAAEALEEVEPRLQKALIESLDSERAAGIVEEMDPGAAADLLSELSDERSEAILGEMDPEERQEVKDLLEFPGDWAAGRMTTDYVHAQQQGTVSDAIEALRAFEGDTETVTEIYLIDKENHLTGVVPLARIVLAEDATLLASLSEKARHCDLNASGKYVAELFDKYNLRSLAVLEADRQLAGVIYAEHVIALLREER
jgi:sporulation protein YlmC with PRC-barrel domain/CBS domain-containing protein